MLCTPGPVIRCISRESLELSATGAAARPPNARSAHSTPLGGVRRVVRVGRVVSRRRDPSTPGSRAFAAELASRLVGGPACRIVPHAGQSGSACAEADCLNAGQVAVSAHRRHRMCWAAGLPASDIEPARPHAQLGEHPVIVEATPIDRTEHHVHRVVAGAAGEPHTDDAAARRADCGASGAADQLRVTRDDPRMSRADSAATPSPNRWTRRRPGWATSTPEQASSTRRQRGTAANGRGQGQLWNPLLFSFIWPSPWIGGWVRWTTRTSGAGRLRLRRPLLNAERRRVAPLSTGIE